MIGQAHFRVGGRVDGVYADRSAEKPVADLPQDKPDTRRSRVVWGHLLAWQKPVRQDGELTWWARGSVDVWHRPELVMEHGGVRVGKALQLRSGPVWLDGWFLVDEGPLGDAVLAVVDSTGRAPVSVKHLAESGQWRRHAGDPPGVEFTGGSLLEVACVGRGAFGRDAALLGRTVWPAA